MKRVLIALAVVFGLVAILVGGSLYYVYANLESLIEQAIETYGSEMLGTEVRVDRVEIDVQDGWAKIAGLSVANPPGYGDGDALGLGEISIQIDPASLAGSPISIPQVNIMSPMVDYRMDARGKSNIDALLAKIETASEEEAEAEVDGSDPPLRFAIGRFVFDKGHVRADLTEMGAGDIETDLPSMQLTEIGGRDGATAEEVGTAVGMAFLTSASKTVVRAQGQKLIDEQLQGEGGEAAKALLDRFTR